MNNILISKRIPLTARLTADMIYISNLGEITICTSCYGPNVPIPHLTVEYLESLCSQFYFGNPRHKNAIADILLINNLLRSKYYDEFYFNLRNNLEEQRFTVISSELTQDFLQEP